MAFMQLAQLLTNMTIPLVEPLTVNLPAPPELKGVLAPNNVLAQAVKFADNMLSGPESMVISNGYVYTGLSDGYVVEIKPNGSLRRIRRMSVSSCGRSSAGEGVCGRPLGVRENNGFLIVADAYHGIIALNPVNGNFRILVSGNRIVKGKKIGGFINDLAVAKDGSVYFTTSSSKYTRKDYLNVVLEAETSGRVLVYNSRFPGREKVRELVTTLNFPNGLQLSKDEDFLLIVEGARARIHKAYIDRNSPKFGKIETFATNLPGFVDNIRASPRGTYWVGLSRVRHAGEPSVLDEYGNQPILRAAIMGMPRDAVMARAPKYGMVVELNANGQIIRSLHDPMGVKFSEGVSEVQEENGILYLGSFNNSFIGKLNLRDLPRIQQPTTPDAGVNEQLAAFLNQIRERMANMGPSQIQELVISLVKYLVQVKLDAMKSEARANQLEKEAARLQATIEAMSSATTPSTATTTKPPPLTTTTPGQTATTTTLASGGGGGGTMTPSSGGSGASSTTASSPTTASGTTSNPPPMPTTTSSSSGADTTTSGSGGSGTTSAPSGTTASTAVPGTTSAAGTTSAGSASTTTVGDITNSKAAGTTASGTTAGDFHGI